MTTTTLSLSILANLASSLLYLYVGRVLRHRQVGPDAARAQLMFVVWWETLGWLGIFGGVVMAYYVAAGGMPLWLYKAYVDCVLLGLFIALWGLQYYLVYLYSGSSRSFAPLAGFYGVLFLVTLGLIEWSYATYPPTSVSDDGWQLLTLPKVDLGLWPGLIFSLVIIGPQIVAAGAYFMLFFKTQDPTQRYRIGLIAGSIIIWFGLGLFGSAAQISTELSWQLFNRVVSILGAVAILMAYRPPQWVQQKYGIRSIRDETAGRTATL